jgi:glycine cleavage system aminomethyltransferase T
MTTNNPILEGAFSRITIGPQEFAFEYTGYQDEILASKTGANLCVTLCCSPVYDVKGADAIKFLNSVCVNDFSTLQETGRIRHAIICNNKGQILTDGVVMKISDDTFRTYWLESVLAYYLEEAQKKGMDVQGVDVSFQEYFFQIDGVRSLEILEKATEGDLHDIQFARQRMTKIAGKDVRILRLGMSGSLAYEIHGPMDDANEVYSKIWEAGQEFGIKKMGFLSYCMQHTEGGFPNINLHYPMPWFESDPGLADYLKAHPGMGFYNENRLLVGSMGDDLESRFVTPYDVGWGFLVNFNHDFMGKEALQKILKNPPKTLVSLEWNADDVGAVYASQFKGQDVEPSDRIDYLPDDLVYNSFRWTYRNDKVLAEGVQIGQTGLRTNSYYYRRMLSLAFIEKNYAQEGRDVTVIWGTPGTPQKEIRAKIVRFPYNTVLRNESTDVETIPHYKK